jgi:hypothetical protein
MAISDRLATSSFWKASIEVFLSDGGDQPGEWVAVG